MFKEVMIDDSACCTVKPETTVPIFAVLNRVDEMLAKEDYEGAERICKYWLMEARAMKDKRGELAVLNELMGLYRKMNNKEKAIVVVENGLKILADENLQDISAGTIYVNAATTMKFCGDASRAMGYYQKAKGIYQQKLQANDGLMGALQNNMGLCYADLGDKQKARDCFNFALGIMKKQEKGQLEVAITYLNIADLLENNEENQVELQNLMEKAFACFEDEKVERDGYYAFNCRKCAGVFKFYGFFAYGMELNNRADKIYARN